MYYLHGCILFCMCSAIKMLHHYHLTKDPSVSFSSIVSWPHSAVSSSPEPVHIKYNCEVLFLYSTLQFHAQYLYTNLYIEGRCISNNAEMKNACFGRLEGHYSHQKCLKDRMKNIHHCICDINEATPFSIVSFLWANWCLCFA